MNPWNRIQAEHDAIRSLSQLYEDAQRCKELYEHAQMSLPEPLKRFLGLEVPAGQSANQERLTFQVPAPSRKRPDGADMDWVWVRIQDCTPTTLICAALRAAGGSLQSREAIEAVQKLKDLPGGSIYNSATRLQREQVLDRADGWWHLTKPDTAPIIDGDVVWGAPATFDKIELATHRRLAILHILSFYEAGLQIVQLVEQLRN